MTKKYTVEMKDGSNLHVEAEIVTYDQVGNLLFANERKVAIAGQDQNGVELVQCINLREFIRYYPTPTYQ